MLRLLLCVIFIFSCGKDNDDDSGSTSSSGGTVSDDDPTGGDTSSSEASLAGVYNDPEKSAICAASNAFHNSTTEKKEVYGRIVLISPIGMATTTSDRSYFFEGMAYSFNQIATYLNIDLDLPCVVIRRLYSCNSVPHVLGLPVGNNTGMEMRFCYGSGLALTGEPEPIGFNLASYNPGQPIGHPHEMVHIFMGTTVITPYFDEGLADFIEDTTRVNYYTAWDDRRSCSETQYRDNYNANVWYNFIKYSESTPSGRPGIDRYISAACFWKWVEANHGHGKIREVMVALHNNRNVIYSNGSFASRSSITFKETIISPILGQTAVDLLTNNWDVPAGAN